MKSSQKLIVKVENFKFVTKFEDLDKKFHALVRKLEIKGNEFGPVIEVIDCLCVSIEYADGKKKPTKRTIFGYDKDEFLAKQY